MSVNLVSGSSVAAASNTSPSTQSSITAGVDNLANENTFLKLFIAQLQHQDPMNPQDSTQFVAQLATFSNLEQVMQMRSDISAIRGAVDKLTTPASTSTAASGTTDTSASGAGTTTGTTTSGTGN